MSVTPVAPYRPTITGRYIRQFQRAPHASLRRKPLADKLSTFRCVAGRLRRLTCLKRQSDKLVRQTAVKEIGRQSALISYSRESSVVNETKWTLSQFNSFYCQTCVRTNTRT